MSIKLRLMISIMLKLLNLYLCSTHIISKLVKLGGNPGLVVKGGDSCTKGRGFESQHRLLDGHLFQKAKVNEKEAGDGTFFLKTGDQSYRDTIPNGECSLTLSHINFPSLSLSHSRTRGYYWSESNTMGRCQKRNFG